MRLKIISDGTLGGTQVVNADTDERIEGITDVTWTISSVRNRGEHGFGLATLTIRRMSVILTGKVTPERDEAVRD